MQAKFADRGEAGRKLAARLEGLPAGSSVIYALPRGGIPVAVEVAQRLHAPLDLLLVRKLPAPGEPEVALGAVAEGTPPVEVINEDVRRLSGADKAYIDEARRDAVEELDRRRRLYRGEGPGLDPKGLTALVIDDGLATGATARAAVLALKARGAGRIILGVPVAPPRAVRELLDMGIEVVCLLVDPQFDSVGRYYRVFPQLADADVARLLSSAPSPVGPA